MAEKRKNSWLVRYFWPLAIVVVAAVVAIFVLFSRFADDQRDGLEAKLNERYEQKIEIKSETSSGSRTKSVVYIDGERRDDCSEEKAQLSCSDEPQPTVERSQN